MFYCWQENLIGGTNDGKGCVDGDACLFFCLFHDKLKVRFVITMKKKKDLSTLPQSAVGHDKAWTHHRLQLHAEWCKQWQIPSSLVMRAQLIGVTHSDGCLVLALGWGAELPDWIIQKWLVIRLLPAVSSGCIQYFCSAVFTCLCFSMPDNRSTWLFQFVIEWTRQRHSHRAHVDVWQRTMHLIQSDISNSTLLWSPIYTHLPMGWFILSYSWCFVICFV